MIGRGAQRSVHVIRPRHALLATTAALLSLACSRGEPAMSRTAEVAGDRAPGTQAARVLAGFPATPSAGLSYRLAVGDCGAEGCVLLVQLADEDDRILGARPLEWKLPEAEPEESPVDEWFGLGDPLAEAASSPAAGSKAWTAGSGESTVSTTALAVRLGEGLTGLLVQQLAGFDHLKRRHDLFGHRGGELAELWSAADGTGPYRTRTAPVPARDTGVEGSRQDILYFEGFEPGGDAPDELRVVRLSWDEEAGELMEREAEGLAALWVGPYPTAAAARQAEAEAGGCLSDFFVLPGERLGSGIEGFVLAALTSRRELAEERRERLSSCVPDASLSITVEVR